MERVQNLINNNNNNKIIIIRFYQKANKSKILYDVSYKWEKYLCVFNESVEERLGC